VKIPTSDPNVFDKVTELNCVLYMYWKV